MEPTRRRSSGSDRDSYAGIVSVRCGIHQEVEPIDGAPSVFEWAGGAAAFSRMTRLFYERYVPAEPLLAPLFADMATDHPERVAAWLAETFGGPKTYTEQYGGYDWMVSQHAGKALTEAQRAWLGAADEPVRRRSGPADRPGVPSGLRFLPRVGLADRRGELQPRRNAAPAHARSPVVVGLQRHPGLPCLRSRPTIRGGSRDHADV